jgi:uncharacterized protein
MPWIMTQRWAHLLYLHYRVEGAQLRPLVPPALELDVIDGSYWVSLIPLHMEHVHLRGIIPIPTTANFPELNLRTYVHLGSTAGVWFLSIDAASFFSTQIARRAFRLPYHHAHMKFAQQGEGFHFTSRRSNDPAVRIEVEYAPRRTPAAPQPGTLLADLAERYTMFSAKRSGVLLRGDITHDPWHVQPVDVRLGANTALEAVGLTPLDDPVTAYSPGTTARAWPMLRAAPR